MKNTVLFRHLLSDKKSNVEACKGLFCLVFLQLYRNLYMQRKLHLFLMLKICIFFIIFFA